MASGKGISLPVNVLVILSVAIIVLLSVVAFFMAGLDLGAVEEERVVTQCCSGVARNPEEYCDLSVDSWDNVPGVPEIEDDKEDDNYGIEVEGEELKCSDYVGDPSDCPECEGYE
ncbi:MAG: hypothetical protein ACLFTQ_00885 [Candidatus Aenigmatarchaeota archaeon]